MSQCDYCRSFNVNKEKWKCKDCGASVKPEVEPITPYTDGDYGIRSSYTIRPITTYGVKRVQARQQIRNQAEKDLEDFLICDNLG